MSGPSAGDAIVVDNAGAARYEIEVDGETAFLSYKRGPRAIVLIHTEVPPALRRRGLAATLAKAALDASRAEGLRVIVRCPYVQAFIRSHPEYQ